MRWKALTFRHLLDSLNIYFGALEKFLRVAEVKTFEFFGQSQTQPLIFQPSFSKKSIFFYCYRLLKRFVCCLTTRVAALESPDLQVPSRYLEHLLLTSRKFFTGHWSQRFIEKFDHCQNTTWKTWLKIQRLSFDFGPTFR